MAAKRIGLRDIRKIKEGETVWDTSVPGFGVRRQKGQALAYILKYRTAEGRQRWYTIGRHGAPWTPEQAREEAIRTLGEVKGVGGRKSDPAAERRAARNASTVSELCDLYLADAEAGRLLTRKQAPKRPTTLATDRGRIEAHIKPLLGSMPVTAVSQQDVDRFLHDVAAGKTKRKSKPEKRKVTQVRGGRGAATRTVGLLGAIFKYAVQNHMRIDNPVRGVMASRNGPYIALYPRPPSGIWGTRARDEPTIRCADNHLIDPVLRF